MIEKYQSQILIAIGIIAIIALFTPLVNKDLGGTRFPNGISADSTSPAAGEVRGADLTLTDAAAITGDLTVGSSDLFVDVSADQLMFGTSTSASDVTFVDPPAGDGTAASTTLKIGDSGTTTSRGQLEIKQQDGGVTCAFVNSAGTGWILTDGVCGSQ